MNNASNRADEIADNLAMDIWNTLTKTRNQFLISEAVLSVIDSNLILSYPKNDNLESAIFTCDNNTENVLSSFSIIAGKSPIQGKVYCRNHNVQLFFR